MTLSVAVDLAWSGAVEIGTIASRHAELATHIRSDGIIRLRLDAAERIDTAGWQLLVAAAREVALGGAQLQLCGVSSALQLEATQLGIMPTLAPLLVTLEASPHE